jgi:hypothetical protein
MVGEIYKFFALFFVLLILLYEETSESSVLCNLVTSVGKNSFIYLAATTLFHNESRYIKEWVTFHHIIGFQEFLLYNHNSTDDFMSEIASFVSSGVVIVQDAISMFPNECDNLPNVPHRFSNCQKVCFLNAIQYYRDRARWIAVFDIDEFIFPSQLPETEKTTSITEILQ